MALILGRGRRRDRFGQCLVAFDDLPAGERRGAGSRGRGRASSRALPPARASAAADRELAEASDKVLDERDEERGIDALTAAPGALPR